MIARQIALALPAAAMLLLLPGAALAAGPPPPEGWMRAPLIVDNDTRWCRQLSDDDWDVRSVNGSLSISRHDPISSPRIPVKLEKRLKMLPGDPPAFKGTARAILLVDRGWLVGLDYGEFGGGLWWIPEQGSPELLYGRNTEFLFLWGGVPHAAGGLAHMSLDVGFVLELKQSGTGWDVGRETRLRGDIEAVEILDDRRLLVVSDNFPSIVFRNGRYVASPAAGKHWYGLYPNSAAGVANNRIAVGMKYAVAELSLNGETLIQTGWLVRKNCVRLEPVPGAELYKCRCVPAPGVNAPPSGAQKGSLSFGLSCPLAPLAGLCARGTIPGNEDSLNFDGRFVTTFRVTRAIKGVGPETREIEHTLSANACGVSFRPGTKYQVYANRWQGISTGACSWTHIVDGRRLRPDAPVPAETLEGVIRQIRDPKLKEQDAEYLFHEFQERERNREAEEFISSYLSRAEWAAEWAASGHPDAYREALMAANFYEGWGDHERAAAMYALAEKLAPDDAHSPTERGRALLLAGHAAAAVPHLERALRLQADHPDTAVLLARARLISEGTMTPGISDYRDLSSRTLALDSNFHSDLNLTDAAIGELSARRARLPGVKLGGASLSKADFRQANLAGAVLVGANISTGDFTGASLRNAYAVQTNLSKVRFNNADLRGIKASQSFFVGVDLSGARLEKADFTGSNLSNARLQKARIRNTIFNGVLLRNALLQGADLRGGTFKEADLLGARIDCLTRLPRNLDVRRAGLIPVRAECNGRPQIRDFTGRDWEDTDFSDLDLRGATFAGVRFGFGANRFTGSNLQNSDFSETSGVARFSGADLSGADFSRSSINAKFFGAAEDAPPAVLTDTRFADAILHSSSFIGGLYSRSAQIPVDYTAATFEKAVFHCSFGNDAARIERESKEPVEPFDPSKLKGRLWDSASEIERRIALRQAKNMPVQEIKERKRKAAVIRAERNLVAFLRQNWPSVTFDENCSYYLQPKGPRPQEG